MTFCFTPNTLLSLVNKANLVQNFSYYIYFFSLHVLGNYAPIIRRINHICATLVFATLYGLLSGLPVGMNSNWLTRQQSIQSDKYQCHIETVNSPDDGCIVARNM